MTRRDRIAFALGSLAVTVAFVCGQAVGYVVCRRGVFGL